MDVPKSAWRPGAADPHPGGDRRAVRPRHQCAGLVLWRSARLDVRGLQRRPARALSSCRSRAARCISAMPSPRRMRARTLPPSTTTAERQGDNYVHHRREVACDELQSREPHDRPGASSRAASMTASIACSSARPMRRASPIKRSPAYTHTYNHHHPILTFDRCRSAGRATASARKATAWASPMPGSGASD